MSKRNLAYYSGLVGLAAFGVVDWPIIAVIALGHYLTRHTSTDTAVNGLGEALKTAG